MKSLFLHAGAHKTGSSSIQKNLERHAARLEEVGLTYLVGWNQQFAYPHDVFRSTGNANPLAYAMRWKSDDGTYSAFPPPTVFDHLFRTIADKSAVVLSHEDLVAAPQHFLAAFRDAALAQGWQIRPVIFVRDQISWHVSNFNQYVRQNNYDGDFEPLVARTLPAPDWSARVKRFEAVFGREMVTVRLYHRELVGKSIAQAFVSALGFDPSPLADVEEAQFNVSLSNTDALLLSRFNRLSGDRALSVEFTKLLKTLPRESDCDIVTDAMARFLRGYYERGNATLCEEYLAAAERAVLEREMNRERETDSIGARGLSRALSALHELMRQRAGRPH